MPYAVALVQRAREAAPYDETKHQRGRKGTDKGGQFVSDPNAGAPTQAEKRALRQRWLRSASASKVRTKLAHRRLPKPDPRVPLVSSSPTTTVTEKPKRRPSLRLGSTGEEVLQLQHALARLGIHVDVNGRYDAATVNAIKGLQRRLGLRVTGRATAGLVRRLKDAAELSPCAAAESTAVGIVSRATEAGFRIGQLRHLVGTLFGGKKVGGQWKDEHGKPSPAVSVVKKSRAPRRPAEWSYTGPRTVGSPVVHPDHGRGTVTNVSKTHATIRFTGFPERPEKLATERDIRDAAKRAWGDPAARFGYDPDISELADASDVRDVLDREGFTGARFSPFGTSETTVSWLPETTKPTTARFPLGIGADSRQMFAPAPPPSTKKEQQPVTAAQLDRLLLERHPPTRRGKGLPAEKLAVFEEVKRRKLSPVFAADRFDVHAAHIAAADPATARVYRDMANQLRLSHHERPKRADDLVGWAESKGWVARTTVSEDSSGRPRFTVELGNSRSTEHYEVTWRATDSGSYQVGLPDNKTGPRIPTVAALLTHIDASGRPKAAPAPTPTWIDRLLRRTPKPSPARVLRTDTPAVGHEVTHPTNPKRRGRVVQLGEGSVLVVWVDGGRAQRYPVTTLYTPGRRVGPSRPMPPRLRESAGVGMSAAVAIVARAVEAGFNPRQIRWGGGIFFGGVPWGGRWRDDTPGSSSGENSIGRRRGSGGKATPRKAAPSKTASSAPSTAPSPASVRKATPALTAAQQRTLDRIRDAGPDGLRFGPAERNTMSALRNKGFVDYEVERDDFKWVAVARLKDGGPSGSVRKATPKAAGATPRKAAPTPAEFDEHARSAKTGPSVADLPPVQVRVDASSGSDTGRWRAVEVTGLSGSTSGLLAAATSRVRISGLANDELRVPGGRALEQWEIDLRAGFPAEARARLEALDAEKRTRRIAAAKREIAALDRAMAQSQLPSDVVLWRGARPGDIGLPGGDATGFEWTDPGFLGTSATREVAEYDFAGQGMLLRILAPAGTPAIGISGGGEAEVLLNRGLRFRVVAEHKTAGPGSRRLDVEVVPSSGSAVSTVAGARSAKLSTDPAVRDVQIDNRVRAAYRAVLARRADQGDRLIGLADLRAELGDLDRSEVDAALKRMGRGDYDGPGRPFLTPENDQSSLTARDRDAAVSFGGQPSHLIRFDDPSDRPLPRSAVAKVVGAKQPKAASPAARLTPSQLADLGPDELVAAVNAGRVSGTAAARRIRQFAQARHNSAAFVGLGRPDAELDVDDRERRQAFLADAGRLERLADEVEARPAKAAPVKATKAAKKTAAPKLTPAETVAKLRAATTRDEARAALAGMTHDDLKQVAQAANMPVHSTRRSQAALRADLVEYLAGRRLDSRAIRGDEDLPYGPGGPADFDLAAARAAAAATPQAPRTAQLRLSKQRVLAGLDALLADLDNADGREGILGLPGPYESVKRLRDQVEAGEVRPADVWDWLGRDTIRFGGRRAGAVIADHSVRMNEPGPAVAKVAKAAKKAAPSPEDRAALARKLTRGYKSGKSLQELADETGMSATAVHRILTSEGVALRPRGAAKATGRAARTPSASFDAVEKAEQITRLPRTATVAEVVAALSEVRTLVNLRRLARELNVGLPTDFDRSPAGLIETPRKMTANQLREHIAETFVRDRARLRFTWR